tara:strand:+ start:144 stop:695 length:552 start_codon:yes stop_codon:yes gene_type:complete
MKTILSSVQNFFGNEKNFGPMAFLLAILLIALVGSYSNGFNNVMDTMGGRLHKGETGVGKGFVANPAPAQPLGENSDFASVSGMKGTTCNQPDCNKKMVEDPSVLLPNDANSAWAKLNPSGQGSLQNVNLLDAGAHHGIQAQVNRNANLQLRSEPANPRSNVGPWQQSTIEPDRMRKSLEIGA